MNKCEICDRDVGRLPWLAQYCPVPENIRFDKEMDYTRIRAYYIETCGNSVCVFRARKHGVPGATYKTGLEAV